VYLPGKKTSFINDINHFLKKKKLKMMPPDFCLVCHVPIVRVSIITINYNYNPNENFKKIKINLLGKKREIKGD
jgi:hypothetical protein